MNARTTLNDASVVIKSICWQIGKLKGVLFFKCELEGVSVCIVCNKWFQNPLSELTGDVFKMNFSSHSSAALPQYHHFSSLALHKLETCITRTAPSWVILFSFCDGHIIVDFSSFFSILFWMYDMITKLLQDNTQVLLIELVTMLLFESCYLHFLIS